MKTIIQQLETKLAACTTLTQYINSLNVLAAELRYTNLARARALNRQAEKLARADEFANAPYDQGLADAFYWRGKFHMIDGDYQAALICFFQALPHCERLDAHPASKLQLDFVTYNGATSAIYSDSPDRFIERGVNTMNILNCLGVALAMLEQFAEALDYYHNAERLALDSDDVWFQAVLANNVGFLYREMGNWHEAKRALNHGLGLLEQLPPNIMYQRLKADMLDNSSRVASRIGLYPEAISYGEESLAIFKHINWHQGQAEVLNTLGLVYQALEQYDLALACLKQAHDTAETLRNPIELVDALIHSGDVYRHQNKPEQAIATLMEALNRSTSASMGQKRLKCHQILADIYEASQEYALALQHYKLHHQLQQEIFDRDSDRRIKVLQVIHQVEQKQREAELYQLRNVLLEQEIAERKRIQAELEVLATTDELTGLWNRRHFFILANQVLHQAQRYRRNMSVMLLDLDHFKYINDTYGHLVGDDVLRAISALFRTTMRQVDILGRYGGEEFVMLLPETNLADAHWTAERLRVAIEKALLQTSLGEINITLSIGITEIDLNSNDSLDLMLNRADHCLYAAKSAGRNTVKCFAAYEQVTEQSVSLL